MNEHLGLRLAPRRASTPGPPPDTRARMSRFACAFSLVRTVMRRAAPPAALGLVATNRDRAGAAWLTPTPPPLLRTTPHGPDPYPPTQSSGMLPYPTPIKTETLAPREQAARNLPFRAWACVRESGQPS